MTIRNKYLHIKIDIQKLIFILSIIIYLLIGIKYLNRGVFTDEEDNFAVGSLLLKGFVLYKDIFTHHFPFAYYWTSLVFLFKNNSIFIARLSVLLFQLFTMIIVAIETQYFLAVSITAITWILLRNFVGGQMLLYHTFAAFSLMVIYIIGYKILIDGNITGKYLIIISIFSFIAILSTPLSVYTVIIVYTSVIIKLYESNLPNSKNKIILFLSSIFILFLIFIIYLIIGKTFLDFINEAIVFNTTIYSKYSSFYHYQSSRNIMVILDNITSFLQLRENFWYNINLMRPINVNYGWVDQWIFTGFLYRVSFIILSFKKIIEKKYIAAISIIFIGSSLLVIGKWGFHGQPIILNGIFTSALIIQSGIDQPVESKIIMRLMNYFIMSAIIFALVWLNIRLVKALYDNLDSPSYQKLYIQDIRRSTKIKKYACNDPNVKLIYYPGGYIYYFFTGIKPFSKYLAMWPWMAEVGQDEVINKLKAQNDAKTIVVIKKISVWGYNTQDYLKPLSDYIKQNYIFVEDGIYLSPSLSRECKISR